MAFSLVCFEDGAAVVPTSWMKAKTAEDSGTFYYPAKFNRGLVLSLEEPDVTWPVFNGDIICSSS